MILVWVGGGISILRDRFPHSLDEDVRDNANSSWQSVSNHVTCYMALHVHRLEAPLYNVQ